MSEEKTYWKQKAHIRWMTDRDRNSKFFHSSVAIRRAKLAITRIKTSDDTWLEDFFSISAHAIDFFRSLLTEDGPPDAAAMNYFLTFIPNLLTQADNANLMRPVSMGEIKSAIFGLDPDSSPGADGFPGHFYQVDWDIISQDLLLAV